MLRLLNVRVLDWVLRWGPRLPERHVCLRIVVFVHELRGPASAVQGLLRSLHFRVFVRIRRQTIVLLPRTLRIMQRSYEGEVPADRLYRSDMLGAVAFVALGCVAGYVALWSP